VDFRYISFAARERRLLIGSYDKGYMQYTSVYIDGDPMKKVFIAALLVAAAALFAMPASAAQSYDSMTMDASQSYLRLGFDDSITVTVHLMNQKSPSGAENVPIAVRFKTADGYVVLDKPMVVTNATGQASAVVRLNASNQPSSMKLPMLVMVEAVVIGNDGISSFAMVYITNTGPIKGYILDDTGATITGALITVTTPDGKIFPGGPYRSNEETPMGAYEIDNLPMLPTGPDTLTATKNGYTGVRKAEPGLENVRNDITIGGYQETIDVPSIVTAGNANASATPTPVPDSQTPTKPTTKTTTILIAIALITLVYIGLKAYRRMF
jgi:hypothetical protein